MTVDLKYDGLFLLASEQSERTTLRSVQSMIAVYIYILCITETSFTVNEKRCRDG